MSLRAAVLTLVLAFVSALAAHAQSEAAEPATAAEDRGRILLVLPFDNRSGQPNLEWIREAAPEILSRRFSSAGFSPMSRTERMYALDHLGFPLNFHPTRATALKLAQTLDADSIIVGSFTTDGTNLVAEAQIVDVAHLRMSPPVVARGPMSGLISVYNSLAWKLTRELDPDFRVAEETFVAASAGVSLGAFEQYVRGITESDQQERLRHLNLAVQLKPDYGDAWLTIGRDDFARQKYEDAAAAFAKVGRNTPGALAAGFYGGLSLLYSGDYPHAEEAFAGVARILPLAEVLNNEGVALARRGEDPTALFRRAVAADPQGPDYHFNLALALKRHNEVAEAQSELTLCLKLRPTDSEAQTVDRSWRGLADSAAHVDPLERIVRNFDETAFHQASQMLDRMDEARLAALNPHDRARALAAKGHEYLDRGLLLEAERHYQSAIAADARLGSAHAGLAAVRERSGDAEGARREAHASLELELNPDALLVLGRLELAAHHLVEARQDYNEAIVLDPKSLPAVELRRRIELEEAQQH